MHVSTSVPVRPVLALILIQLLSSIAVRKDLMRIVYNNRYTTPRWRFNLGPFSLSALSYHRAVPVPLPGCPGGRAFVIFRAVLAHPPSPPFQKYRDIYLAMATYVFQSAA
jgi:hypothetical protein